MIAQKAQDFVINPAVARLLEGNQFKDQIIAKAQVSGRHAVEDL